MRSLFLLQVHLRSCILVLPIEILPDGCGDHRGDARLNRGFYDVNVAFIFPLKF